jgi:DNA-binding transcriptional MerR regulator/methylmalonyl-CoA mutase cobalamin-binding subunit
MNYTVKAAARATGVSESRLRTWERRYGIPSPARSASRRRLYDESDLGVIRRMAALVDAGLSAADAAEAVRSGQAAAPAMPGPVRLHPLVETLVVAAESFDEVGFVDAVEGAVAQTGWAGALDDVIFPALKQIGARWESATVPPAKEHFASELIRRKLAAALDVLGPSSAGKPRLLLACPEGERHDLGLLGLGLLLRSDGVNVVYLGPDVPTADIIEAQAALDADGICLSATSAGGLASLVRASRTIIGRRAVHLFVGGPALGPSGSPAAGVHLPASIGAAAKAIHDRLDVAPQR